jgi:hypothetical protein
MPQNGGGRGWSTGASGEREMPELWAELLEWLLLGSERSPRTQKEWAEGRDIHADSLRRIKRDPRFVREWDRRCAELNIHPERTQSVIDSLFRSASDGDVKAASLYLQYIDKYTPKRRVVVDDERAASGLSDLELADELEALVAEFRDVDVDVDVQVVSHGG